ncbi:MAG: regulatory iron-sulfur-containing complex subunit RicT [Leptospirillia bacterium]
MIVKVRVRDQGNPSNFRVPEGVGLSDGDTVLVDGERGTLYGIACGRPQARTGPFACCQKPDRAILKVADASERSRVDQLREREQEALAFCRERAEALGLPMKMLDVEAVLDSHNITCFFTADQRIDFRQLVKDVGSRFRCHVLMRQISTREETRCAGGIGPCGRTVCCAEFMNKPPAVSSRDARKVAPGVSHAKLTGICGKLMCCLAFENGKDEAPPISLS